MQNLLTKLTVRDLIKKQNMQRTATRKAEIRITEK